MGLIASVTIVFFILSVVAGTIAQPLHIRTFLEPSHPSYHPTLYFRPETLPRNTSLTLEFQFPATSFADRYEIKRRTWPKCVGHIEYAAATTDLEVGADSPLAKPHSFTMHIPLMDLCDWNDLAIPIHMRYQPPNPTGRTKPVLAVQIQAYSQQTDLSDSNRSVVKVEPSTHEVMIPAGFVEDGMYVAAATYIVTIVGICVVLHGLLSMDAAPFSRRKAKVKIG
ncbi:hypothetical protein DFS34DRAFT_57840 [Phlyctochytrium arcticum]|nr:hypothetical protein DFS34DRAFT_57840 [Phlyctochytrium arcticum]